MKIKAGDRIIANEYSDFCGMAGTAIQVNSEGHFLIVRLDNGLHMATMEYSVNLLERRN